MAFERLIVVSMKNHIYQFENQNRLQNEGGATGLVETGELADVYMLWWDDEYMKLLKSVQVVVDVFKRFKDYINNICEEISTEKAMKILKLDCMRGQAMPEADANFTANLLCKLANSVDDMITFTVDTPDMNQDNKLPMLDVKVHLDPENMLIHEFYEKSTKSKNIVLANSALSWPKKRNIHTQECLRILKNTSVCLGEQIQNMHLSRYMLKMKMAGYNSRFRGEIVKSTKNAYKIWLGQKKNGQFLYRNREEMVKAKKLKNRDSHTWWQKSNCKENEKQFTSILFVPPTPKGELAKMLKKREMELNLNSNMNIKIIEKGGIKVKSLLVDKNPFKTSKCLISNCPFCNEDKILKICDSNKMSCSTHNFGYSISCSECPVTYEGESHRKAAIRAREHNRDLENNNLSSPLVKHMQQYHPQGTTFKFKIVSKFSDALTRQSEESVRIQSSAPACMNSKAEFNAPPITRISVETT